MPEKSADLEKKTATSQTHFGFTNVGSNMYQYRNRAICNNKFRFGSPCRMEFPSQKALFHCR